MGRTRIGGLDALRGLAALAVFICHLAAYWSGLGLPHLVQAATQVGAHGVDVFVVLSGFVLTLPLIAPGRSLNVRQFYGRRMWRILPAYWAALAFASVFALGPMWDRVVGQQATLWDLVVHVFALQTVFVPTLGSINGSLWSISLEILLYLVFPVIVLLLHRLGGLALVLSTVGLTLVTWWAGTAFEIGGVFGGFIGDGHTLPMRLVQFVAGMVLASVLLRPGSTALDPTRRNRLLAVIASAVTGLAATAASTLGVPQGINLSLWAACGAALVWLFALLPTTRGMRLLDAAGSRAYSFYLVHQPIVLLAWDIADGLPGPPVAVLAYGGLVTFLVVCAAAEMLFRFVERPSHHYAVRRFPNAVRRPADAVPEGAPA